MWKLALLATVACGRIRFDPLDGPGDGASVLPAGRWASVGAGDTQTCAIDLSGALWCWGSNGGHELGTDTDETFIPVPTRVGSASWLAVRGNSGYTCGIQANASMWCWGYNVFGAMQFGPNAPGGVSRTPVATAPGSWASLSTFDINTCGIRTDGTLWCWGDNSAGQLGNGNYNSTSTPQQTSGTWLQVAAGDVYECAIRTDHTLWCMGSDQFGQLGDGGAAGEALMPLQVPGQYLRVAAASATTCAVQDDGALVCFGADPGSVPSGTNWTDVSAGFGHFCAQSSDSSVTCWGENTSGQLGAPAAASAGPLQVQIAEEPSFAAMALGGAYSCLLSSDHNLWCAGANATGQLGTGTQEASRETFELVP